MTFALAAVIFINLFATTLLVGGTAMVCWNIVPEKHKMPTTMALRTHHAMFDLKKDSYMKPSGILSGLSAIVLLILLGVDGQLTVAQGVAYGIGLAGIVVIVVTANRFLIPFHTRVLTWSAESPPAEYAESMQTFQKVTNIRLATCLVILLAFVMADVAL
jgi:hypothetical protein